MGSRSQRATSQARNRRRSTPDGSGDLVWNALSVLLLLGMAVLMVAFAAIYMDANSRFNPFPPPGTPTPLPTLFLPSQTASSTPTEITPSTTPTITSTETTTPIPPTFTVTVTMTSTETMTPGPTATATINSVYPFIVQNEIQAIAANTFPDHDDCKLYVAGRAYDMQGAPYIGATVQLGGYLTRPMYQLSLTGTALQYGPSGYEFTVAELVRASQKTLWVQLLDQAKIPLSGQVKFDTYEDCTKNLILINFKQVR